MVGVIGQSGRGSRESQVLWIVGLELPDKEEKKDLDMMTLKQWDIADCEPNNGCRNRRVKMWAEGQGSSSDPSQFSEIEMTKSWKELVENILSLLPDDENVSVT